MTDSKVFVVIGSSSYGQSIARLLSEKLTSDGMQIIDSETVALAELDTLRLSRFGPLTTCDRAKSHRRFFDFRMKQKQQSMKSRSR